MPLLSRANVEKGAVFGAAALAALGAAGTGDAQPRMPQSISDVEWTRVVDAGKNPISSDICRAVFRTLAMSLKTPEAKTISPVAKDGILNFLDNGSGTVNCSGNRLLPWTRANNDHDLIFIATAIDLANEDASAVATVEASKKAGRLVRINIHLPTAFGVAPARTPVPPAVGSKGPAGGPSG